jgi:uncharacterized protein YbbC (DUF1343 family)
MDAALLFPGTCLIEGTNISEGRGTAKPFEMIGAPWLDPEALAETLNALKLPGFIFRPVYFKPWAHKFKDERCGGVQVHIIDRRIIKPVEMGLALLEAVQEQDGGRFAWRPPVDGRHFIDLLAGTDMLRKGQKGEYRAACKAGAALFASARRPYLLY